MNEHIDSQYPLDARQYPESLRVWVRGAQPYFRKSSDRQHRRITPGNDGACVLEVFAVHGLKQADAKSALSVPMSRNVEGALVRIITSR